MSLEKLRTESTREQNHKELYVSIASKNEANVGTTLYKARRIKKKVHMCLSL